MVNSCVIIVFVKRLSHLYVYLPNLRASTENSFSCHRRWLCHLLLEAFSIAMLNSLLIFQHWFQLIFIVWKRCFRTFPLASDRRSSYSEVTLTDKAATGERILHWTQQKCVAEDILKNLEIQKISCEIEPEIHMKVGVLTQSSAGFLTAQCAFVYFLSAGWYFLWQKREKNHKSESHPLAAEKTGVKMIWKLRTASRTALLICEYGDCFDSRKLFWFARKLVWGAE